MSGFELVADELELYDRIEGADLVITAEGFLDAQSFEGKVVGGVLALADAAGVPTVAIAGEVYDGVGDRLEVVSLVERFGEARSHGETLACIEEAAGEVLAAHAARHPRGTGTSR